MVKKFKNYWLLGILLFVMLLAACSNDDTSGTDNGDGDSDSGEEVNLTFTMWGGENDVEVYEQRLKNAKEVYPNINVEINYIPSDYSQKVQTMIAGGTAPDILQLAEDIHAYSSKNQLAPLNDYVKDAGINLDETFGTAHQQYTYEDNLYALPDRGGAMVVYYNKDMFDEAGVDYPTKDWTWDEFLDAAQKLTIRNGEEVEQWGFAAGSWWPWWMSFMYHNGGGVFDEDGNLIVDSEENVEALQFYNDLVHEYKVAPSPTDFANMGDIGPDQLFAQGELAFEITGFWNVASLATVPDLNWDIAPLWGNEESGTVTFGSGLAVSNDSKHKDEAFKIIEYLTSEDGQMPIVEMKQDAPANVKVLASDAFLNGDWANHEINMQTFEESASMVINLPLIPEWNRLQTSFNDNLAEVWTNEKPVEDALKQIHGDLEGLLR